MFSVKITDGIIVFPIIEALSQLVKKAENLHTLQLDMELSATNLSIITSALHKCKKILSLKLLKASNGPPGFKHLQNLIKSGKIQVLDFCSVPTKFFNFTSVGDDIENNNEYVYEDEALISEESKLKKLTPLLKKIFFGASWQEKEISPVEIIDGVLHPCVRYSNVYPLPICSNHKTGPHYICQVKTVLLIRTHTCNSYSGPGVSTHQIISLETSNI